MVLILVSDLKGRWATSTATRLLELLVTLFLALAKLLPEQRNPTVLKKKVLQENLVSHHSMFNIPRRLHGNYIYAPVGKYFCFVSALLPLKMIIGAANAGYSFISFRMILNTWFVGAIHSLMSKISKYICNYWNPQNLQAQKCGHEIRDSFLKSVPKY